MRLARHVEACHSHDLGGFIPLLVAGRHRDHPIGWVRRDHAASLHAMGSAFEVESGCVRMPSRLDSFAARSEVMMEVTESLWARGLIPEIREEMFPVVTGWEQPPLFQIDRGAVVFFGIAARKVQLNGYVGFRATSEEKKKVPPAENAIWVAQRSWDSLTAPGKFDTLVVGGHPIGLSSMDTLVKEGWEEAGLPRALALAAARIHDLSYVIEAPGGLRRDRLRIYDLALSRDFVPANQDGEIIGFRRLPARDLLEELRHSDDYKFNTGLVLLDFLLRHGAVTPFETGIAEVLDAFVRHHAIHLNGTPADPPDGESGGCVRTAGSTCT